MKKYFYFAFLLSLLGCGQPIKILPFSTGYVVISCTQCSYSFTFFGKETISDTKKIDRSTWRSEKVKVTQYKGFSTLTINNAQPGNVTGQIYVDGRLVASESKYFPTANGGVLTMNYNSYK